MQTNNIEYNELIRKLANLSDQVIFLFDLKNNRFIEINPYFEELTGLSKQKFRENPSSILDYVHKEDKEYVLQRFNELKDGEVKKKVEFRFVQPDLSEKWICLSAYILINTADSFVFAGFAEDISTQKEYLNQLLRINSRKNSTMEILSHDLAGPLGTIQSLVSLIEKKEKDRISVEALKYTEMIKETCKRSINLITEFVNQEFIESTMVTTKKDRIELVERIKSIIDYYKVSEQAIQKNFELESSEEKFWLEVDDLKFMQVINNLISNAIKFTKDDGIIRVILEQEKDKFIIKVKDDGVGIPKKFHPYLFDKFTKARRPGLRGEKSIGLGMSIIKTIVEYHNGVIWFESEENKGTTFVIELPHREIRNV
ncbi:MAG TPA: PAS domain-containing sensor histidine kinase [Cytophagales bacterium]|nr:PAS domain-containing sensor histidine kinase [Cytophagales bacterium]